MSQIHSSNTLIEVKVRKYLFHEGFRYRKNVKQLPGKPDIVLPKYKTVIFVQGCFWHRHPGCKEISIPKTRTEYWKNKFDRNVANDKKHVQMLQELGWNVILVWECEINKHFDDTMQRVVAELNQRKT